MGLMIPVGSGFVRLDGHLGDDLSVVNAARVSFGRRKTELDDADHGLIRYLMAHRHGTPFEHNAFRFHVSCPLYVAREWFRHRIGSFNEFSMRYAEASDEFHIPEVGEVRTQVGKPGAYTFEVLDEGIATEAVETMRESQAAAYRTYRYLLALGVAREVARGVLPMATMTEFYWTVNARSLMNFLCLRNHPDAQAEIRAYAVEVERMWAATMPVTYLAWVENDRRSP